VCCSVLQCVAAWCSVLQCVAVCCGVLQCVAVCVYHCIRAYDIRYINEFAQAYLNVCVYVCMYIYVH